MRRLLVLCALLLGLVTVSQAATKYAARTGCSDSNPGTEASPYCTIDKCLRTIGASGTCYLRQGTYPEGIDSNNFAGTSFPVGSSFASPVLIASYPGETATVRGPGGGDMVNIAHAYIHHVVFDRLVFDATNYRTAVSWGNGAHHLWFQNGEVKESHGICGDPNNAGPNVLLDGVGHQFTNSNIHHSACSYGFYIANTDGTVIEQCEIHDNYGYAIQLYDGSNAASDNAIIRNNRMYNNGFGALTTGQFAMTISNGHNALVANNVVYNNKGGIEFGNNHPGARVFHNTIYNNQDFGLRVKAGSQSGQARNNIIFQTGTAIDNQGPDSFAQSGNLLTNPMFVNAGSANFHLATGSPAIDAVACLGEVPTDLDGDGRPLGARCDQGADEFGALPPPVRLRFSVQPTTTPLGQALASVVVQVEDASGNIVSGAASVVTVSLGLNPGGAILSGTLTRTAASGLATFTGLSLDAAGTPYTLVVTSPGLTGDTSTGFAITTPTAVAFQAQPQGGTVNQPMAPVTVTVLDNLGTLVTTAGNVVTVALSTNPGGATLLGTTQANAVNGVATFPNLALTAAGVGYGLRATSPGLASADSTAFTILGTAPPRTEWLAQGENWLRCVGAGNGGVNTSGATAGTRTPHTLACTLPAFAVRAAQRVRACSFITLHTGASTGKLEFALTTGGGAQTLVTNVADAAPQANILRSSTWVCFVMVSGGVPGPATLTVTSFESHYPEGLQFDGEANAVAQPVAVPLDTPLELVFNSKWILPGSGDATLEQLAFLVEVQ